MAPRHSAGVSAVLQSLRSLARPPGDTHVQTVCVAERGSLLLALTGVCLTGQTADIVEDAESSAMARL